MSSEKQSPKPYEKPQTPRQRESNYEVLYEHDRTDGSFKPLEELEMEYVTLTDKLIHTMTDGGVATVHGERQKVVPTKAIFMDKSARPLAWLTNELWDTLAPEPGADEIPDKPDFKFLNIDRKQWLSSEQIHAVAKGEATVTDVVDSLSDEKITALRSIFNRQGDGSADAENEMDNQVLMIIDEVKATGATMQFAKSMIGRAFPTSTIITEYWMESQYLKAGAKGNNDLPVWYKHNDKDPNDIDSHRGRGVANRETNPDILAESPEQQFLSRRWPTPDPASLALRRDFKKLAHRVKPDYVPTEDDPIDRGFNYIPANKRDDDSMSRRSEVINKGQSYVDVMLARRAIKELYQPHRR